MYGLRYNSEEKLEGQVGLTAVNILGHGRTGYIGYRQSSQLWDARIALNVPYLFGYRADNRFSLWARRESREAYISEEYGASAGQEIDLRKNLELDVFYNLSRVHDKNPEAADFGPWTTVSEASLSFVRDTRNDRFDARTGTFTSLSLTAAPKFMGADIPYAKLFSQYSFYLKAWRGVYWASNIRFGAITEVGADFPANRLFYAGGGTSLRGFEQDRVGPINPATGSPTGGRFIFLLNEELRIPLIPLFSGVLFYDVGNVYASLEGLSRFDLRQGIGAGLRFRSPIGLIRFDCGFNPFPRENEPKTVLFLSIGQTF
jgi:outer membrane protein assembly factor BamA